MVYQLWLISVSLANNKKKTNDTILQLPWFSCTSLSVHVLEQHSLFLALTGENETLAAKANVCFLPGSAFNILQSFTLSFKTLAAALTEKEHICNKIIPVRLLWQCLLQFRKITNCMF